MFHCIYRCTNIRSTVVFYSWKVIDSRVFYTTKIYLRNKHFSSYAQALLRTLRYCSRHLTLCVPPLSSWDRSRLNGVTYFCACSSSFSLSLHTSYSSHLYKLHHCCSNRNVAFRSFALYWTLND